MKKLVIGCDHAAPDLKNKIRDYLTAKGYDVVDVGTHSTESCHYPLIAHEACKKIISGECEMGILICGTGIGISIAANKHKGIRAACCSDTFSARLTRMHNDANVLCFGARVVGEGLALDLVDAFLGAEFEGGERHTARVNLLSDIENGKLDT